MGIIRHTSYAAVLLSTFVASSAGAAIGTTDCSSSDGQVRRTEMEIWGANDVTWIYHGAKIPFNRVTFDPEATWVISDFTTDHPEYGDQHVVTFVEKASFVLSDGSMVTEHVLCKTVEYPRVID